MLKTFHAFHIVNIRPWPVLASFRAIIILLGLILIFIRLRKNLFLGGIACVIFIAFFWWRDIIRERLYQGNHSINVTIGLKVGIILFITSEIFFFISFFWSFFHSSLSPVIEIGSLWPPMIIFPFNPFIIPLLNTSLLLTSGVTLTWSHHRIFENNINQSYISLLLTVILGIIFTTLQWLEYKEATFSIRDSIYGSTFFVATGFHGLHVIIGSSFLVVCLLRIVSNHFSSNHHLGFEAAAWYWHFVDVVWLFLFISIYWWGQ